MFVGGSSNGKELAEPSNFKKKHGERSNITKYLIYLSLYVST